MAAARADQANIKVTVFMWKRPDLTGDEFHKYWSQVHAPKIVPILKRHGVLHVHEYHLDERHRALAAPFATAGIEMLDYDGMLEIVVPDMAVLHAVFTDPQYLTHVAPDEFNFCDRKRSKMVIGWERELLTSGAEP